MFEDLIAKTEAAQKKYYSIEAARSAKKYELERKVAIELNVLFGETLRDASAELQLAKNELTKARDEYSLSQVKTPFPVGTDIIDNARAGGERGAGHGGLQRINRERDLGLGRELFDDRNDPV